MVVLSCPKGTAKCKAAEFTATATSRHVVVATGGATLAAGSTKTLSVVLNRGGLALFAKSKSFAAVVKVSSGGKTIRTSTVLVHKPVA